MKFKLVRLILGEKRYRSRKFSTIYRSKKWGGSHAKQVDFHSGTGSLPQNTRTYEELLIRFIIENNIQSVVDIGCGDFQVSQRILRGLPYPVNYLGCDVVKELIDRNQALYGTDNINFRKLDAVEETIPRADLVVLREVLQHLSNDSISKILDSLKDHSFIVATNTRTSGMQNANVDIKEGGSTRVAKGSGLDLGQPPFNRKLRALLTVPHSKSPTVEIETVSIE